MSALDFEQATVPDTSSGLDFGIASGVSEDDTPEISTLNFNQATHQTPQDFFKYRLEDALSNVSVEFGGKTQFGRTTMQGLRGLFSTISTQDTDVDRLHQDLNDLTLNEPELANSEEGQAYRKNLVGRIRSVMDADEIGVVNTIKLLVNKTIEDPAEMIDMVGDALIEDPALPLLFAAAYHTGGRSAHAAAKMGGLSTMIARMQLAASPATRAGGLALQGAVDVMGVMGAEAGMGFVYEMAQNKAIGRDPMHNAQQIAAMSALLGGGIKGLSTAYKMVHGFPGRYTDIDAAVNGMMDAGFEVPQIIKLLDENMSDLPKASMDKAKAAVKAREVSSTKAPFDPSVESESSVIKGADKLVAGLHKAYVDRDLPGATTVSNIWENKGMTVPVATTAKKGVIYNLAQIVKDFNSNSRFRYLRGETEGGKLSSGRPAQTRALAFKDFDFKEFEKWITQKGGAKGYGEFLMRLEANKLRYGNSKHAGASVYKRAALETLNEMGADPRRFNKAWQTKVPLKLEAGMNYVKRTAQEVAANPALLYQPIKDIIQGTKQFTDDVLKGPAEGAIAYMRARNEISNMLRDWEGGRMAGELPINDFANYVKGHLKTQDKLNAMSHYLEGNIDKYNAARREKGLEEVHLSPKDLEAAAPIRKFFDDTLDWAQKAGLFMQFRRNKQLYNAARNYSEGNAVNPIKYSKGKDGALLEAEMWDYIKELESPRDVARHLTPEHLRDSDKGFELLRRKNYVPHVTKGEFAPTEEQIIRGVLTDAGLGDPHRAAQLQTRSRFTKHRVYDTLLESAESGQTLLSEDISSLIKTYGKSMLRAQMNQRLITQLAKMKSKATGKGMIGSKADMPDYYVEFKHPNFADKDGNYLYVNPNIAPDLRLYFETSEPTIANRMLQNIILISKRSALGLSLFHMMALGWSGLASGQAPGQIVKNMLPLGQRFKSTGLRALAGEEGYEVLLQGMRNGLGIGILEELKGDTLIGAIRRLGAFTENTLARNQYLKPIGKMGNMGFKGLARAQEIIDTHLWDHVNTGLKATTYITTFEKMVLRDARAAKSDPSKLTDKNILAQRAAQFTNDAYGNQNWNQMAMNVQSNMGHRIAAALNKPSMRGYIRMLVFAPDWTLSNARVIGKGASGLYSKSRKLPGAKALEDYATPEYMAYSIRSALLFAFVAETLQQASGQGSIFDDSLKDALRPDLGDGKQMEISKQLSEVIRIFIHGPGHVGKHKMGTLPKSLEHTDSIGEYLEFWGESSLPIGIRQAIENEEVSGVLGVPIYKKY